MSGKADNSESTNVERRTDARAIPGAKSGGDGAGGAGAVSSGSEGGVESGTEISGPKVGSRAKKVGRTERRFVATRSVAVMLTMAGIVVGGFGLGAGVYGQWLAGVSMAGAPWCAAVGVVAIAVVLVWGDWEGTVVRVGDAGVAWERRGKVTRRVAWCDMREVWIREGKVGIGVDGDVLTFPVDGNLSAAAWVAKEAQARISSRWKGDSSGAQFPKTADGDGEILDAGSIQVAGRPCRASGRSITFEADACFCTRCGEVYLKGFVPEVCLTCEGPVGGVRSAA